jgi:hypothetical protein
LDGAAAPIADRTAIFARSTQVANGDGAPGVGIRAAHVRSAAATAREACLIAYRSAVEGLFGAAPFADLSAILPAKVPANEAGAGVE